jgi:hypothetical protein
MGHRLHHALIAACMLLYPAVRVGPEARTLSSTAAMILGATAYLLAVYLYYGIATLAYRRSTYLIWFGGLGGMVIGYFVSGVGNLWLLICGWSMVFVASVAVGRMAGEGRARLTVYLIGAAVVAAVVLALYGPKWVQIMKVVGALGDLLIKDFAANLQANGYTPDMVRSYSEALKKLLNVFTRLVPASMLLGAVAQYSIGYLWFYGSTARSETETTPMESFFVWKNPVGGVAGVIVGVIARLAGGETLRLVADNLLAVLAVFYCITGLALIEFYMRRLGFPRIMRVLFYLLLFFTQLAGFVAAVLLGFIDSFADWRKVNSPNTSVENENGSIY